MRLAFLLCHAHGIWRVVNLDALIPLDEITQFFCSVCGKRLEQIDSDDRLQVRPWPDHPEPAQAGSNPMTDETREQRFALNQAVNNAGILLYQLADLCLTYLKWELYGKGHKHGLSTIFAGDRKERATGLAELAADLFQEIGLSKEDMLAAWEAASRERSDGE